MKIAYFVHCSSPAVGGLEYLSGEIVTLLREAGHDVHVITGQGRTLDSYKTFSDWVDTSQDPDYIHRLPLRFSAQRWANRLLNKAFFLSGTFSPWYFGPLLDYDAKTLEIIKSADLNIGAGMPTNMFYDAYRFAKKWRKRLILHPSYHNVCYYNRSIQFQQALSYASVVIYQTPLERDQLTQQYRIDPDRLRQLTYCPYSESDWKKAQQKAKERQMKLEKKLEKRLPITIGFVGQITLRKNLQFFVQLLKDAQGVNNAQMPPIRLLLAGAKTNSADQVEALFKSYSSQVEFIYDFPSTEKDNIFKRMDIFVNPSLEESLGLVNFEALSAGLPVIIPNASAFASLAAASSLSSSENHLAKTSTYVEDLLISFKQYSIHTLQLEKMESNSLPTENDYRLRLLNILNMR